MPYMKEWLSDSIHNDMEWKWPHFLLGIYYLHFYPWMGNNTYLTATVGNFVFTLLHMCASGAETVTNITLLSEKHIQNI